MKRTYIITGFSRYLYPALVNKSRQIIASLNGNSSFAELSPLLDEVKTAIDVLKIHYTIRVAAKYLFSSSNIVLR